MGTRFETPTDITTTTALATLVVVVVPQSDESFRIADLMYNHKDGVSTCRIITIHWAAVYWCA